MGQRAEKKDGNLDGDLKMATTLEIIQGLAHPSRMVMLVVTKIKDLMKDEKRMTMSAHERYSHDGL